MNSYFYSCTPYPTKRAKKLQKEEEERWRNTIFAYMKRVHGIVREFLDGFDYDEFCLPMLFGEPIASTDKTGDLQIY